MASGRCIASVFMAGSIQLQASWYIGPSGGYVAKQEPGKSFIVLEKRGAGLIKSTNEVRMSEFGSGVHPGQQEISGYPELPENTRGKARDVLRTACGVLRSGGASVNTPATRWRQLSGRWHETGSWCRRSGLNTRPHPYQGCALPLSYGGLPGWRHNGTLPGGIQPASTPLNDADPAMVDVPSGKPRGSKPARQRRQAQELRANLLRRKAQARARETDIPASRAPTKPDDNRRSP